MALMVRMPLPFRPLAGADGAPADSTTELYPSQRRKPIRYRQGLPQPVYQ